MHYNRLKYFIESIIDTNFINSPLCNKERKSTTSSEGENTSPESEIAVLPVLYGISFNEYMKGPLYMHKS